MDARDAAANNADLWSAYLRAQWSAWLDPFGLATDRTPASAIAEAGAAGMAAWLGAVLAPAVAALYAANAPQVTRFLQESAIAPEAIDVPEDYARPVRPVLPPPLTRMPEAAPERARALVGAL